MLEISYGRVAMVGGGLFDPQQLYGKDHFWSWSLGLRLGFGGGTHRMGRYGAALSGSHLHQH
jgi:hypothetical protein